MPTAGNPLPMIAAEFAALLRRQGLTQAELVKESGVNRMTVRAAFHGQQVSVRTAVKLLEAIQRHHEGRVHAAQLATNRDRHRAARPEADRSPRPCACNCGQMVVPDDRTATRRYVNLSHRWRAQRQRSADRKLSGMDLPAEAFVFDLTG